MTSKLGLQIMVGALGIIPPLTSLPQIFRGLPASFIAGGDEQAAMDSDYRYWGALWTSLGVGLYLLLPHIETETLMFRMITGAIFFGGLARVFGALRAKYPLKGRLRGAVFIEVLIIPILIYWQSTLAAGH